MTKGFAVLSWAALGILVSAPGPLRAEEAAEPDPCAAVASDGDLRSCWGRQAEQAERELKRVLDSLLARLPRDAGDRLKKAQQLWLEFRDAHVAAVFADGSRARDPYRLTCLLITRRQLALARLRQLKGMAQGDPEAACSL
jgi:uncharacterized protein YecT (DUF1311 family)